jgi:hypothetical protein
MDGDPTTYERLLRNAYDRGVADARAAAALGLHAADAESEACRGLAPQQLAAQLWARRPSRPPAGLPLNGARWYAAGYRAGLAEYASCALVPRTGAAGSGSTRQLAGLRGV